MPVGLVLLALAPLVPLAPPAARNPSEPAVLVFSRTAGYRHESIPDGVAALRALGGANGFAVAHTEDPAVFTDEGLRPFDAVVFLSTTGDVLAEDQERAFERYIRSGRGFVGIHAAADTEYDWPWFGGLVGAYFKSHPAIQPAEVRVTDRSHPSTRHLPARWNRNDEWYDYRDNPRGRVHVLMTLDERSYQNAAMGHDHPIAWCHLYDGGRSFYTGGGHTSESFTEPEFLAHILGGIRWAAGWEPGDAGGTVWSNYEKVILTDHVTDPMELAVASDGRVFFVERPGAIRVWRPETGAVEDCGFLDVFSGNEDGLLGIALDPEFDSSGWMYVYYSPAGDLPLNRLARLTIENNRVVEGSILPILDVATQREECCHSGGSLAFGPDGCLYISTGDNTNPFASGGFAPIDERPGREPWDAQKSSSNANDLRGKILRIIPNPDGSYSIPEGNLFPSSGNRGRPEIYVMGCRNPFRISIDPSSGTLYWGDVGPDASETSQERGPSGFDEFNRAAHAGNFGWPYFVGDNQPYRNHDFEAGMFSQAFDPAAPRNDSPSNSGPIGLPPAQPAWIWYPYAESEQFPVLGSGGRCAMAGPVLVSGRPLSDHGLPSSFDGSVLLYEWARNWIMAAHLDESGELLQLAPFFPTTELIRPHELELGPDGCLYLIEWGTGFGGGNPDARISRIEYYRDGLRPPVARMSADATSGPCPLESAFDATGSASRIGGSEITFEWDFDGNGSIDSTDAAPRYTYTTPGNFVARFVVRDRLGPAASASIPISVGNSAPTIRFVEPPEGGVFGFGDWIDYRLDVRDAEDASIDAERSVVVQPALGHDTHAHPLRQYHGVAGTYQTLRDASHGEDANLFGVLHASYQDRGAPGVQPLTARTRLVLQPRRKQAEHFDDQSGIVIEKTDAPEGPGAGIAYIEDGDWVVYRPVCLSRIHAIRFRVASGTSGGTIELRLDAPDGPLLASASVPGTGGWQNWTDVETPVTDPGGTHSLYLLFRGGEGSLLNLDWLEFAGRGIAAD